MVIVYAICDYFKINEKLLYTYVQIIDLNELRIPWNWGAITRQSGQV